MRGQIPIRPHLGTHRTHRRAVASHPAGGHARTQPAFHRATMWAGLRQNRHASVASPALKLSPCGKSVGFFRPHLRTAAPYRQETTPDTLLFPPQTLLATTWCAKPQRPSTALRSQEGGQSRRQRMLRQRFANVPTTSVA